MWGQSPGTASGLEGRLVCTEVEGERANYIQPCFSALDRDRVVTTKTPSAAHGGVRGVAAAYARRGAVRRATILAQRGPARTDTYVQRCAPSLRAYTPRPPPSSSGQRAAPPCSPPHMSRVGTYVSRTRARLTRPGRCCGGRLTRAAPALSPRRLLAHAAL